MSEINLYPEELVSYDEEAAELSRKLWDAVAKPLGSLGLLEEAVTRIIAATADPDYTLDKRAVLTLCADNGVVGQGVTMTPGEVTTILAGALAQNLLTVNRMAAVAHATVYTVDMGISKPLAVEGLIDRRIGPGTNDISLGPAMTREQAIQAIHTGIDLVRDLKAEGYKIICAGEAGIGNTTTSSALAALLLQQDVESVTGRGVGLTDEGLARKVFIIKQALEVNKPNINDPLDMLAKLGGFDIAGMCGIYLGGAKYRVPIVVDGIISSVAALLAARLFPQAQITMLASHQSAEPAAAALLQALELSPLICAGMRVGEGTGAVAALPLLDMAFEVFRTAATYGDLAIG
ncbi:MAG: nicotinate-nucleotide--dimethylbenzimidazole phosphoribosyltransferase [Coriobacteriia bacterium]|nr:nicotinate-nucleotide--dimethylbenzimidazole phosphoribosyltransferase [Coriobacteriia bacterium]